MITKEEKAVEKILRCGFGYKDIEKLDIAIDEMISDFEEAHRKYKSVVQEVIDNWSPAGNSDFFLFIEVLRALNLLEATSGKDNFIFKIKRGDIKNIPSPETISRCRRSLNAKGLCLPDDPRVITRRKSREKAIRKFFSDENKARLK